MKLIAEFINQVTMTGTQWFEDEAGCLWRKPISWQRTDGPLTSGSHSDLAAMNGNPLQVNVPTAVVQPKDGESI